MHQVHGFECANIIQHGNAPPVLARLRRVRAPALKPTHKAGRRGGDSIAR